MRLHRTSLLFLAVFVAVLIFPVLSRADSVCTEVPDAGQSPSTAQPCILTVGLNTITGHVGTPFSVEPTDMYAITIPVAGFVTFILTPGSGGGDTLDLFKPNGTLYMENRNGGSSGNPMIAFIPSPGTWYLAVTGSDTLGSTQAFAGGSGGFLLGEQATSKPLTPALGDSSFNCCGIGFGYDYQVQIQVPHSATPEPNTLLLLGTGFSGLALALRRKFIF